MRKYLLLLFVMVTSTAMLGQYGTEADTLVRLLRSEGRTTKRIDLLLRLGFVTYESPDARYEPVWREAQTLSQDLRYEPGLAHAPMEQAMRDFRARRYAEAISGLKLVIARLDALGVDQDFNSALGLIRIAYNAVGDQGARYTYFTEALARYERSGLRASLGVTHHALAGYYSSIRQYASAVEHYMKARELFKVVSPRDVQNETMVIGWSYERWGNPQRAIPFLQEALAEYAALDNRPAMAEILLHLADDELTLGDTVAALRDFERSREHWAMLDPYNAAIFRSQYLLALMRMDRVPEAGAILDELRGICASNEVPLASFHGVCELDYCGYVFHTAIGEPARADSCLERALTKALRLNDLPLVLKYRKALMTRLLQKGDAAGAASHAALYVQLNDSLQAVSNTEAVAAYEGQVKEHASTLEIQRQLARMKQQRTVILGTVLGLLMLAALAWSVYKGKKRSDELLLNILPAEVAQELKSTGTSAARHIEQATILFTDFKGFTEASERLTPQELVQELDTCFKAFDAIITACGIEKIKTIGDAYMAAGGLPRKVASGVADVVHAALDMQEFMIKRKAERTAQDKPFFEMRVGVHTGPVVAGIVGVKKFQYDIWGDTVNTASRMESSGEVGQVNISESTYREIVGAQRLRFTPRGKVQAKGKGEMEMYFVERKPVDHA